MTAAALAQAGHSHHKPHGWLASILVHMLAAGISAFVFAEMKPPSQPESFRWDVALAQATPAPVEPPTPTPPQPRPTVQAPSPAARPVEAQPVVQRVQTVRPVERVQPVVREEQVQHHHIVESVAQNADVLKHAVQSEPVQAAESLQKADVIQKTPAVEATAVEPVLAAPSVRQLVQAEPSTQVSPRPSAVTHAEPLETHTPVPLQHAAVQQREAQTVESPAPLPQTAHAAEPNRQVMERPAVVTAQTKMDYSWLTQELLTRLERSKRYPYTARLNRWEGRVVVKAVVRDDGQVVSLQIAESSGHAVLDNDAMELIRQVSPIQLKYPLGKAQVALLVPVGYSLH